MSESSHLRGPDESGSCSAFCRAKEKVHTLKHSGIPSEKIKHHPLSLAHLLYISPRQSALVPLVILGEDILKVLRNVATFHVKGHCVGPVLNLVYSVHVKPEEMVRKDGRSGRVGHNDVDDGGDEKRERD